MRQLAFAAVLARTREVQLRGPATRRRLRGAAPARWGWARGLPRDAARSGSAARSPRKVCCSAFR